MRYFYYISKSKVEMLLGQVKTKSDLSKIHPKVEGFGLGVELEIERGIDESADGKLARDTNKLINLMSKEKMITSLNSTTQFNSSDYFHDENDWTHGLYTVRESGTENHMVTYLLWKAHGRRIFLLLGSPMNVLGTKEVNEGMEHKPSSSSIINNVIETSLHDEFIGAIHDCAEADSSEKLPFIVPPTEDSTLKININSWIPNSRIKAQRNVLRGSALAVLCQKTLTSLSSAKIETTFKIFYSLPVSRSIAPFDVLHLGSPIFTALK